MSKITTRTLTPAIGAVVEGIDLSQKLADEQIAQVRAALLKHKVIFFKDQHITPVQHRDFAARFGDGPFETRRIIGRPNVDLATTWPRLGHGAPGSGRGGTQVLPAIFSTW